MRTLLKLLALVVVLVASGAVGAGIYSALKDVEDAVDVRKEDIRRFETGEATASTSYVKRSTASQTSYVWSTHASGFPGCRGSGPGTKMFTVGSMMSSSTSWDSVTVHSPRSVNDTPLVDCSIQIGATMGTSTN